MPDDGSKPVHRHFLRSLVLGCFVVSGIFIFTGEDRRGLYLLNRDNALAGMTDAAQPDSFDIVYGELGNSRRTLAHTGDAGRSRLIANRRLRTGGPAADRPGSIGDILSPGARRTIDRADDTVGVATAVVPTAIGGGVFDPVTGLGPATPLGQGTGPVGVVIPGGPGDPTDPDNPGDPDEPTDPVVPAVPEPASWILMIFGIGMLGMVLRRCAMPVGIGPTGIGPATA